jgi:RNA ligase (TIGR02306 family)
MNDFKVEVVRLERIEKHPNADRLDLAFVRGWQVVTRKGELKTGDLVVYFPIDSVLPGDLEADLFPPDSKIKLNKSRIKTIKIRGAISQGMIVPLSDHSMLTRLGYRFEGTDVTVDLGVTKYEPPVSSLPASMRAKRVRRENPFFKSYDKMSHFKNYPSLFADGEEVIVTEKIHGTNFRAGWVPTVADTWWKKIKKFFGKLEPFEFVYGSHHVQLQDKKGWNGYYEFNVYAETVEKYWLKTRIPKGYVIYGEVYGPGIQKGYGYGLPTGEHQLRIFDVMVYDESVHQMKYINWMGVEIMASLLKCKTAPVIYKGPFRSDLVKEWEQGPSLIGWYPNDEVIVNTPAQEHREGVVIKPVEEIQTYMGRKVLRSINPEYLMVAETEFH